MLANETPKCVIKSDTPQAVHSDAGTATLWIVPAFYPLEDRGRKFVAGRPLLPVEMLWRETRLLRPGEEALFDNVRFAPVIFQDYVEAVHDLRATVIGEQIFPAAIHSQETGYRFDFRMDMARARITSAELPNEVGEALLRLMRALGLIYGAIDMRRTPDGRHVFLEINPAGQWLFVEQPTGLGIARALAEALVKSRH